MAQTLASLLVDLDVSSVKLRKGLEDAKAATRSFGESMKKMGDDIHALGQLAAVEFGKEMVKGLAEFVMKGAEAADHMGKLAQAIGEPVEEMSRLTYAMSLSGVGADEAGASLGKLNKNIGAAAAGSAESAALFKALGVNVKDAGGHIRSTDAVLGDLADVFKGLDNDAAKTTLAMELFGKSGKDMIPFLNDGKAGIAALKAEADRLGITLSGATVEAVTRFNDDLQRVKAATDGVAVSVAGQLAPAMSLFTEELLGGAKGSNAMKIAADALATAIKLVASAGVQVVAVLQSAAIVISIASAAARVAVGNFAGAIDSVKGSIEDLAKVDEAAARRMKAIWSDAADGPNKLDDAVKKSGTSIVANIEAQKKAAASAVEAQKKLQKVLDDARAKTASIGQGPNAEMVNRLTLGDMAADIKAVGTTVGGIFSNAILEATESGIAKVQALAEKEAAFQRGRENEKTDVSAVQKQIDFGNIGKSLADVFQQATAGFSSFQEALERAAAETRLAGDETDKAAAAKLNSDTAGEHAALLSADAHTRNAAAATKASTALFTMAETTDAAAKAAAQQTHELQQQLAQIGRESATRLNDSTPTGVNFTGASPQDSRLMHQYEGTADALQKFQEYTKLAGEETIKSQMLQSMGWTREAQAQRDAAAADTEMAQQASKAAAAFEETGKRVSSMVLAGASTIASKMGEAGNVISNAIQGFAAGGIWGALIAVIAGIIDKFSYFQVMIDDLNNEFKRFMKDMGPGVNSLLESFQAIADFTKKVIPLGWILKLVSDLLTVSAETVLGTINVILIIWGGILRALRAIKQAFGMSTSGEGNYDDLIAQNDANTDANKKEMADMWATMQNPASPDADQGRGPMKKLNLKLGDVGDSADKAAKALDKLTQEFTNVPQGFKVALRRFNAISTDGPHEANITGRTDANGVTVNITVSGGVMVTMKQLTDAVKESLSSNFFQRHGTPHNP